MILVRRRGKFFELHLKKTCSAAPVNIYFIFQKIVLPPKKTRPKHQSKLYRAVKNPKNTTGTLAINVNPHTNGSAFGMVCLKTWETYDPKGTPVKVFLKYKIKK